MIAVITGFWQRIGFFYESVLSFQASGCLRHHHWPFIDHYGNRDNLFVRCPFYAWLWRCWQSTIPTFRLLLLTFPDLVISCVVLFHCWLKSTLSCIGAHFAKLWTFFVVLPPKLVGFWASGHVQTVLTRSGSLFVNPDLAAYFPHSSKNNLSPKLVVYALTFSCSH